MTDMPASIAKGLVAAQRAVKKVGKASYNPHHNYAYASAQDVAAEAQRALNEAGLALCRVGWSHVPITEREPARLVVTYVLTSAEGESWTLPPASVPSLPGKGRPEDKAEAGALTYSAGYVAQGLPQIERVDENDPDARRDDDDGAGPAPKATPLGERAKALLAQMQAAGDRRAKTAADDACREAWPTLNPTEKAAINKAELDWRRARGEDGER